MNEKDANQCAGNQYQQSYDIAQRANGEEQKNIAATIMLGRVATVRTKPYNPKIDEGRK